MLFLGTYTHNVDEKNRVAMPIKFAKNFPTKKVIISKGFDGCLEIHTTAGFTNYWNKIKEYSQNKKDTRILTRQILANTHEIELDKANRILIPNNLKTLAKLDKEIVFIGLGNKIEIWNANTYKKFVNDTNSLFEQVAERIDDENNNEK